jgi:hypothetical protein
VSARRTKDVPADVPMGGMNQPPYAEIFSGRYEKLDSTLAKLRISAFWKYMRKFKRMHGNTTFALRG